MFTTTSPRDERDRVTSSLVSPVGGGAATIGGEHLPPARVLTAFPPALGLQATLFDLEDNPQLTRLLHDLATNILTDEGYDSVRAQQLHESRSMLRRERSKYMQTLAMYDAVTAALVDGPREGSSEADVEVYARAEEALAAADVAGCTSLQVTVDNGVLPGAENNVFGLTEHDVLLHQGHETICRDVRRVIVSEIERGFEKQCAELLSFSRVSLVMEGDGDQEGSNKKGKENLRRGSDHTRMDNVDKVGPSGDGYGADDDDNLGLPAVVAKAQWEQQQRVRQLAEARHESASNLAHLMKTLQRNLRVLTQVAKEHLLGSQLDSQRERKDWLKGQLAAVRAKVKLLRYQLVQLTYPPEAVKALKKTRQLVESELARWTAEHGRAVRRVDQYAQLGADFDELVREYNELHAAITNKEWSVSQLGSGL